MLAIISHDAGGAEILSSYVKKNELRPLYVLGGPAQKIFKQKLGTFKNTSLKDAVYESSSILCGTSWQSDLELNAIKLARNLNKPSAAYIDHWVNYRERFTRENKIILPDEIWVGDHIAESKIKEIFPEQAVRYIENPYFLDIKETLFKKNLSNKILSDGISILYVCEPIGVHAKLRFGDEHYWGYVEDEALRYFLENILVLDENIKSIKIRPHPSEKIDKYDWAKQEFSLPISQGGVQPLFKEVMVSDIVVGCQSMAMIVALIAGKRVISSIPPGGQDCVLPQPEIEKLKDIIGI